MPRPSAAPRRGVEVTARAKLNLGLAIGPQRDDGFHELATIFQSITLADTLVVRPRRAGFTLEVRYEDASLGRARRTRRTGRAAHARGPAGDRIPAGHDNLVLRAAHLVHALEPRVRGAAFVLTKRIPAQAGLGGGSADAAAALAALSVLYRLRMPLALRMRLAAELGSDVPFAVQGGTARGRGRGERLTPLRLSAPFSALIAMPAWRVSTRRAFERIDQRKLDLTTWRSKSRLADEIGPGGVALKHALSLGNTFEQVLEDRESDFKHLCARLMSAGALQVRLTGSGSAVFAIPGPGSSARDVADRFAGNESLFATRSARSGLRLRVLP